MAGVQRVTGGWLDGGRGSDDMVMIASFLLVLRLLMTRVLGVLCLVRAACLQCAAC